ncbi:hypothetical protein KCM76_03065 [Zooshikella marina]|uniref:DUF6041 domain-containing protein n=1 Tax=Zooshikella ganghwensis TaxID=202772 RepID=UPI001BAEC278|nr:DUF6041 domain-containing protein [Zooshikella ganghwensis]MBU2704943.1 hypothetical protein [Zooshikella ganghwensis]
MKYFKYLFGTLYLLAGIAKIFPQIEDVGVVLKNAAIANQGTFLEGISNYLYTHELVITVISGLSLFLAGLTLLINRYLIASSIGQMLMLICFVTLLHRAYWQVIVMDTVFFIFAVFVLKEQLMLKKQKNIQLQRIYQS